VPGIAHLPGGYFLIDRAGAERIIEHNTAHHPVAVYHALVFDIFVPNWSQHARGVLSHQGLAGRGQPARAAASGWKRHGAACRTRRAGGSSLGPGG